MGKTILESPPKRDEPIFKEGFSVFTPSSARASTPSTKSSLKNTASASDPRSKAETAPKAEET